MTKTNGLLNRGEGNFIHCTDYDDAIIAIENTSIKFAEYIQKTDWGYMHLSKELRKFNNKGFEYKTSKELFNQFIKEIK